jgi:hypothetical protein
MWCSAAEQTEQDFGYPALRWPCFRSTTSIEQNLIQRKKKRKDISILALSLAPIRQAG